MEINQNIVTLVKLVDSAHVGHLCLPNFQRDFVWTTDEVGDLLRSIFRDYYVGSLLLLTCNPNRPPFDPTPLRGAQPENRVLKPTNLILDGQQRITSLVYALYAPDLPLKNSSRRWFFLNLNLILSNIDDDDFIFVRKPRDINNLLEPSQQYRDRVVPMTSLASNEAFNSWLDGFDDWLRENEPASLDEYRANWRRQWRIACEKFLGFKIPVVNIPIMEEETSNSIGKVCAIFEKLNSTGVDLSIYDLLTARLFRSEIRLHDLWEESCKNYPRLRTWSAGKADTNKLGVLVLRTLALMRNLDPKPKILIDLDPSGFKEDWRRASKAMERALEQIELVAPDGFGVFDRKWLPGFGLLPVLAALRAYIDDNRLGDAPREELRNWYWCNVFLERYSSAVESKSRKDYAEFVSYWNGNKTIPTVLVEASRTIGSEEFQIRESTSHASSVYSGVFCLLSINGARDWRRAENIQLQTLQDHHIFPKRYLKAHGIIDKGKVNSIINRTLISDETNGQISGKSPSDYIQDRLIFPREDSEILQAHFITNEAKNHLLGAQESTSNDEVANIFEAFMKDRENTILKHVRTACGIKK
ncbi:MAG: DUF262 domain-containing protein [Proteobacteria bacterium]|nr:DUF262 domain-containing protein [Pseudomonadota bacterium]